MVTSVFMYFFLLQHLVPEMFRSWTQTRIKAGFRLEAAHHMYVMANLPIQPLNYIIGLYGIQCSLGQRNKLASTQCHPLPS